MLSLNPQTEIETTKVGLIAPSRFSVSPMKIVQESSAKDLLVDPKFGEKWDCLYKNCRWGTVFQNRLFVKTWFDIYQNKFDLVLIYETGVNNDLIGLLPLAKEKATGRVCVAGDYHAEYQSWLATEKNGNKFIEKVFEVLKKELFTDRLQFLFLAPNTPLEFLKNETELSRQSELRPHLRPLIEVGQGEKFESSLRKRGNKTRIRQLQRFGEVRLENLETSEQLEGVFDEIENYAHLRLSALHNVAPTIDPNRKPFHKALMQIPNLVSASILRVGDRIASAKVAIKNRDELLLCITSMSPFFARQSPSKIHLLMLGREVARENIPIFDLSPGKGYKERFATHFENAYSLKIFFRKTDVQIRKARFKAIQHTRNILEKLGVTKNRAFDFLYTFQHKLKRVKYNRIPLTIFKHIHRKIYEYKECRIYAFDVEKIATLPQPNLLNLDSIEDLLKYSPAEGWQFTKSEFHRICLERFEAGNHVYTLVENEKLLHYGWMLERQEVSHVFEVGQDFNLPPDSAVLFDYYTDPQARGRGLYYNSLLQGLHDAAKIPNTKQVFIGVLANNKPSRHVIEKLGFVYQGSLFKETFLGKVKKWQNWEKGIKSFRT